jgi:hypothetical protein
MAQYFNQSLGLLQVFRVKPFGEPAVDLRQPLSRFGMLALGLPQPRQTHHGAQFERLGLLLPGDLNGFEETGFGL